MSSLNNHSILTGILVGTIAAVPILGYAERNRNKFGNRKIAILEGSAITSVMVLFMIAVLK